MTRAIEFALIGLIGLILAFSVYLVVSMAVLAYAGHPTLITDGRCDTMLQASVFQYTPAPGYVPCGLQEDEAGDVWSFIHEGHARHNGALTDEDASNWLLRHSGDGVIVYP